MVDGSEKSYSVVLTPQFLEDLESCIEYISVVLKSPIAAREMYLKIKKRVLDLAEFPQAAISYVSPVSGHKRYKITYKNYDIHYVVDDKYVRVLGIKHQLQNDNWIE